MVKTTCVYCWVLSTARLTYGSDSRPLAEFAPTGKVPQQSINGVIRCIVPV